MKVEGHEAVWDDRLRTSTVLVNDKIVLGVQLTTENPPLPPRSGRAERRAYVKRVAEALAQRAIQRLIERSKGALEQAVLRRQDMGKDPHAGASPSSENALTGSGELRKGVDILLAPSQEVVEEPIAMPTALAPSQPLETPMEVVPAASTEGDSANQ